jgi:hypothetical protein
MVLHRPSDQWRGVVGVFGWGWGVSYRFRVDDGKLVLQVMESARESAYYGGYEREPKWRDAKVEDIPITDPFRTEGGFLSHSARGHE